MISSELTAAILAGGLSERLGIPKARLRVQGKELIDFAIELAQRIASRVVIIHREQDDFADKALPHLPDAVPRCGPIGGIYTALNQATTPWVAILPCDVPLLPPTVYELLWAHRESNRPVLARSHLGLEPLISIWPRRYEAVLYSAIQHKHWRLHRLAEQWQAVVVDLPKVWPRYQADFFLNINTPKDWEQAQQKIQNLGLHFSSPNS